MNFNRAQVVQAIDERHIEKNIIHILIMHIVKVNNTINAIQINVKTNSSIVIAFKNLIKLFTKFNSLQTLQISVFIRIREIFFL